MMTDEDTGAPKDDEIDIVDVDIDVEGPVFQTEINIPLKKDEKEESAPEKPKGLPALVNEADRMSPEEVNTYF